MRILITGSNGFVAGSLGRYAAVAGHEVVGIARRSQADADWPGRHFAADVATSDLTAVIREVNPDFIFHGAGTASVSASFTSPLDGLRAATMTWANVLDGVRKSGLTPRIIFPSSAAVYGNPKLLPVNEDAPLSPISPYGFHKLGCETVAQEYSLCFGLEVVICRIFSVYGPAQRRLLVWEIYSRLRGADSTVSLQGTGNESRDYLHVDDLAAAVLGLGTSRLVTNSRPVICNLASGSESRVSALAVEMTQLAGSKKPITYLGKPMSGNPTRWVADVTAAKRLIPGWVPRTMSDGLRQCIRRWDSEGYRKPEPKL